MVARYRGARQLQLQARHTGAVGHLRRHVFLGTVFVCQKGPSCEPEKTFPFFGGVPRRGARRRREARRRLQLARPRGQAPQRRRRASEDRLLMRGQRVVGVAIAEKNSNKKSSRSARKRPTECADSPAGEQLVGRALGVRARITYDDTDWKPWIVPRRRRAEAQQRRQGPRVHPEGGERPRARRASPTRRDR